MDNKTSDECNTGNLLFFEDFESDLSRWTNKQGESNSGIIVEDPLEDDRALSFTKLNAGGDIFSLDKFESPSGKYRLTFDYLGIENPGSLKDDLGGFAGYTYTTVPDDIGNTPGRWLAGTQENYPENPDVVDSPLAIHLLDTGSWGKASIEFDENQPIHVVLEDYSLSGGVAGDVFFDNIRLEALPLSSEEKIPNYLQDLEVVDKVTGGSKEGKLLEEVEERPCERYVGFDEVKSPGSQAIGQTWVIIHGWNSSSDYEEDGIASLIEAVRQKANPNDRVLALDWREAAVNDDFNFTDPRRVSGRGNGKAATWIGPVAQFAVKALQEQYGIDSNAAKESLNLIGHSLGSFVSAEIGRIYRDGKTLDAQLVTTPNGETIETPDGETKVVGGVRTITALDPAARGLVRAYDVDARTEEREAPANFSEVSQFSRAFVGKRSVAGSPMLADRAHEAFELDFGNPKDSPIDQENSEHTRVVKTFTNLVRNTSKIGELFNLDAYESLDNLKLDDFGEIDKNIALRSTDVTYQGIINVNKDNQPTLLTAQAKTGIDDQIILSDSQTIEGGIGSDLLFGEDNNNFMSGKSGNDTISGGSGDDVLVGDDFGNTFGDDILYGGVGKELLTGDGGTDTFVFKAGDGSSNIDNTNVITDFEVSVDKIGLIDLKFEDLSFEGDSVDSIIRIGTDGEFLTIVEGIGRTEIQNQDLFVPIDESIFQVN